MLRPLARRLLRGFRAGLGRVDAAWLGLLLGALVGVLGALAVAGFRALLFGMEQALLGAREGHLVAAAQAMPPELRALVPPAGALIAGLLLWWAAQRRRERPSAHAHSGDYIEAVAIGDGRLDLRAGLQKVLASLLVVGSGGAVGREGGMVLLAALTSSGLGQVLGSAIDLRLLVSCGAAAGLAAAYHAPLAGAIFVAEILLGSLALSQLGAVVVAAVMAYGTSVALGYRSILFPVAELMAPDAARVALMVGTGLLAGVVGALFMRWLDLTRGGFERLRAPLPVRFALGGLVVGLLSLWHPEVWGNGESGIERQLVAPQPWQALAVLLLLKVLAVGATTGSGAPGGVFTPTLFVGAAFGVLVSALMQALGVAGAADGVWFAVVGMATLLAATTHAPVMASVMVFEMTGQYTALPLLLPACVMATLVSRRLHPASVYGLGAVDTHRR